MKRVLIVDDRPENLYMLRALLQGHGYAVDEAPNGAVALTQARHSLPDLVVSDLLMPVMDGYTMLREWKTDDLLRRIPFIVYTATYTSPKDEKLALDMGADAFIIKPAEPESLMHSIAVVLSQYTDGVIETRSPQAAASDILRDHKAVLATKLEKRNVELEARIAEQQRAEHAVREQTEQLRQLSRRLIEVEESERRRLARELHDRIGQNVSILNMTVGLIRAELPASAREQVRVRLDDCEKLLQATGELVRDVMADLRPPGLDELGLSAALSGYASQISHRGGVPVIINGPGFTPRLPPALEIALFRVAQEAIVNALKHAGATRITVTLQTQSDLAIMIVADDGVGFDMAVSRPQLTAHLGLVNIRERAQSIGGDLRIESAPGSGTRVIVQVPHTLTTNHA